MKKNLFIFAVFLMVTLLCAGAVSASNVNNTTLKKTMPISDSKHVSVPNSTSKKINGSGCCSVLLHVKKGYDMFAFRRTLHTPQIFILII